MYRVYVYYLTGRRTKDFNFDNEAISYANKILSKGRVARITIEDMENCKVIFEEYAK